jgi:dimethylglycine dehydrogenase
MKSHVQAVVIGGGVVGCSVLYHLTKAGWKDVVLVERDQLTCGSTWHAAGGFHTLNGDPNVARLQGYTIGLYDELERITGQSCGLHRSGGLLLADTNERMEWLKMAHGRARYLGLETALLSPAEARDLLPLIEDRFFIGAFLDRADGNLDPYGTTHAYAKAARIGGAEVYIQTPVRSLARRADGTWDVITDKGTINTEHVVNAAGLWAREVGRMVGLELPVLAMEHMYLVTDTMAEVVEFNRTRGHELPHAIDFAAETYMRQEHDGLVLGTYEKACVPWQPRQTPQDFAAELLPPDLDRIAPSLEIAYQHFPALARVGIKRVVNGPFTFSPDGNPLVGPVQGLPGFWCACAVMAGFSQGGGVGLALSQWMVNDDPGFDVWAMDVARYGGWATRSYTNAKVRENYSRRFSVRFPNEELPAARPQQTTALYDLLLARGAVMGDSWGLETPLWFAPPGVEPRDVVSFHRSNDFQHVKAECLGVRSGVGVTEIANFAKYRVTGAGAESFLSKLLTRKMPAPGRLVLTMMLNHNGKVIGEFTVARPAEDRFLVWGSSQAQLHHTRWFERFLPKDGSVTFERLDMGLVGLSIAGPRSRELLQRLTDEDVSNEAFRFMDHRSFDVANVPAAVNRVTYTGDLGYEIWVAPEYQRRLYKAVWQVGSDLGLVNFGMRALLCMRLEKNFPTWYRELRPIYGPFECAMERFIDLSKGDFVGRDRAVQEQQTGGTLRRISLIVAASDADALGDEPIWHGGKVVGWVTSGGYGHCVDHSLAQGYVPRELAEDTRPDAFEVEILGERRAAMLIKQPLFDPSGARMRA